MEHTSGQTAVGDRMVTRPIAADWLRLRRSADHRARERSQRLVGVLLAYLERHPSPHDLRVIDIGAGTGSNQAWLAPRLPIRQSWVFVDHDRALVEGADVAPPAHVVDTTHHIAPIAELASLIPADRQALVTCAAVLDVLTRADLTRLADAVAAHTPALLSLTVTGKVDFDPVDPSDVTVSEAFNAHQRRDGLLGPDASETLITALKQRGAHIETCETDWVLWGTDAPLLERYLTDRAAAAVEHDPSLAQTVDGWLRRRMRRLRDGDLEVRVGHVDILSLPASASH